MPSFAFAAGKNLAYTEGVNLAAQQFSSHRRCEFSYHNLAQLNYDLYWLSKRAEYFPPRARSALWVPVSSICPFSI